MKKLAASDVKSDLNYSDSKEFDEDGSIIKLSSLVKTVNSNKITDNNSSLINDSGE